MKKRILSAIVLLLIFVPIFITGGRVFDVAIGLISVIALKEMMDLKKSHSKIPSGVVLVAMLSLLFLVFYEYKISTISYGIGYRSISIMLLMFLLPTLIHYKTGEYQTKDAFYLFGVVMLLGTAFNTILILRNIAMNELLYLIIIATCCDVFAYLFGKLIGRHPLAPLISSKKSIEGAVGGLVMSLIAGVPFYYYFVGHENIYYIIFMSFVIGIMALLGDLVFSKIKRENEVKDYSNLIPGHGGILDRFDSLIFVVLTYVVFLIFA